MNGKVLDADQSDEAGSEYISAGWKPKLKASNSPIGTLRVELVSITLDSSTGSAAVELKITGVLNCEDISNVVYSFESSLTDDHVATCCAWKCQFILRRREELSYPVLMIVPSKLMAKATPSSRVTHVAIAKVPRGILTSHCQTKPRIEGLRLTNTTSLAGIESSKKWRTKISNSVCNRAVIRDIADFDSPLGGGSCQRT